MIDPSQQYIWPWQIAFQGEINTRSIRFFQSVDSRLEPTVFLLGTPLTPNESNAPICIEPLDCGFKATDFDNLEKLATQLEQINEGSQITISNQYFHDKHQNDIKDESLMAAIEKKIKFADAYSYDDYFISRPTVVNNYQVFVILKLSKNVLASHFSLHKKSAQLRLPLSTFFLESAIDVFLNECKNALLDTDRTHDFIRRGIDELLRLTGQHFMRSIAHHLDSITAIYELYENCNKISSLKYEGEEGLGRMILASKEHPNVRVTFQLLKPIRLNDHRKVRKFLELSDRDTHIICDGEQILGLGTFRGDYNPNDESLFFIDFLGHYKWTLLHDNHALMFVEYGIPNSPFERIDRKKFQGTLSRLFDGITNQQCSELWEITNRAADQKHGTMLVISNEAEAESKRLGGQSFRLAPVKMTPELIHHITAIDGAVLLAPDCQCHAIGVILDGIASTNGNASRGARFNSAIRYYDTNKHNHSIMIVIVSEDGMIDIVPNLMPVISKSEFEANLEKIKAIFGSESPERREFDALSRYFSEHEFYLSQEQCDLLNEIRSEIWNKINDGGPRITDRKLAPNPDMNESYFN
jgi:hypothetical protein